MKFLFDVANLYGYDTKKYEERIFILLVFQLAFSSSEKRKETMDLIENWEERKSDACRIGLARIPTGVSGLY